MHILLLMLDYQLMKKFLPTLYQFENISIHMVFDMPE
ncbi:hypothetical protein EUBVEN_02627 [Eubacterium ventriosum ATCC 27560]|uniref:Uncharacterized protein n=1 Tax=Eubacterium ventriosum ATCC 27560 TaxID=411463 RepID=A5ZA80_9FIRM|nr:hypothetical protein EUBVEN_02627 [Eubacterium ventriosum ATCC 27560]